MRKVSKLFDKVSKEYNDIYNDSNSKKLLIQEKKVRAQIVEQLVAEFISPTKNEIVLDIGCGIGNVLMNLKKKGIEAKMYGVDISDGMINEANMKLDQSGYKDIKFIMGNLKDIKVSANVLLSLGVIGYQKKQDEFLIELSNLVDSNGYLIFTTANGDSFLRFARRYLSKLHSFIIGRKKRQGVDFLSIKDKQIKAALTKSGFGLKKKVYITFGLGLFASSIECSIDRLMLKYFSNSLIGKYLSLTVIYVYKRID